MPRSQPLAGTIHQVQRGETLWFISQRYRVALDELVQVNRISDASRIEVGQRIFIPSSTPAPAAVSPNQTTQGNEPFVWPVEGRVISIFGTRRQATVNKGIDIQAPAGTEVVASRSGWVSFIHEGLPGFGKTVILDHRDGFATVYAYMGEILVRPGQEVAQRQPIARVGATGRTEVPALHFEIRRNQKPQNPFYYLS